MNDSDIRKAVRGLMMGVFDCQATKLPANATPETVSAWDSLGHLGLIEEIEGRFGISINQAQSVKLLSEDSIVEFLSTEERAD